MPNDAIDVAYVARLARLTLTDEERATFQAQLAGVLAYMQELRGLDTTGIEPTAYGQAVCNVLRDDAARPGLSREAVLANAPACLGGEFKVPRIVE